jgi:hypothetical protein
MNQSAPSAQPGNSAQANRRMSPVRALLVLAAVLVWSGFLFLVCWAASHMVPSKLTGCAVGAFVGVLTAYPSAEAAASGQSGSRWFAQHAAKQSAAPSADTNDIDPT